MTRPPGRLLQKIWNHWEVPCVLNHPKLGMQIRLVVVYFVILETSDPSLPSMIVRGRVGDLVLLAMRKPVVLVDSGSYFPGAIPANTCVSKYCEPQPGAPSPKLQRRNHHGIMPSAPGPYLRHQILLYRWVRFHSSDSHAHNQVTQDTSGLATPR